MARKAPIVALLTDFGLRDHYAGVMKGVILSTCPEARIVDVSHEVGSQDVTAAYFLLRNTYRYFPKDTLFVVVVDPGVGTERAIVCVETTAHTFLAPDNGMLGFLTREEKIRRIVRVTNDRYFLHPVSNTFQGRDIFAPVAGHLLSGLDAGKLGPEVDSIATLSVPAAKEADGEMVGEVVSIDRFGNLVTNISAPISADSEVRLGRTVIRGISKTYGSSKSRLPLAYIGSGGALEIAINRGSAARALGAKVGHAVRVRKR